MSDPSAAVSGSANAILTWSEIGAIAAPPPNVTDVLHGTASSSRAALRLFGHAESEIRVTLIRDQHSWCPVRAPPRFQSASLESQLTAPLHTRSLPLRTVLSKSVVLARRVARSLPHKKSCNVLLWRQ
jgi:hypothetical protein